MEIEMINEKQRVVEKLTGMQLEESTLHKTFNVRYNGKVYSVDYLNSNGQNLGLLNRDTWEVYCDDEEVTAYVIHDKDGKRMKSRVEEAEKNVKIIDSLIEFCIGHFNDYDKEVMKTFENDDG